MSANADEILVELTPETAYVDTVVEVTTPTEYFIETFTGPRFETVNRQTRERVDWVDSWIELRQGDTVLRADDDSNHSQENIWASKLTGTLDAGTYTIRATSYDYIVVGRNGIGVYTLSSNLIQPTPSPIVKPEPVQPEPVPSPVELEPTPTPPQPEPVPVEPTPVPEPPVNPDPVISPEYTPEQTQPELPVEELTPVPQEEPIPSEEPVIDTTVPTNPDTEVVEQPIEIPSEPPLVEETIPEESTDVQVGSVEESVNDLIAEAEASGEAITVEAMEEAGVTYEDLPPDTPVQVRTDENGNEVIIIAEVAAALQVLESPAELVSAIFSDPGQVLTAITNIGADMSDEERTESEQIIVASVIAGQAAVNAATMAAGNTTRIPSTPSTPAGGPAAGNDKPKSPRRRKP